MYKTKYIIPNFLILFVIITNVFSFAAFSNKIDNNSRIQGLDWINPNLDYVRLNTDSDAPALISLNEILQFQPKWFGLSTQYLHLLHFNSEIQIYIKDNDGILNTEDTLFFLGSRANGDTTFWDNYATEEPFFLTYDDSYTGKRYTLIENSLPFVNEIHQIEINSNIERDNIRSFGRDLYDSYNSDNEGWYWKEILPEENQPSINTFSTFLNIEPFSNDSIDVIVNYKSLSDTLRYGTGSNIYPEYRLTAYFNNDSLDNKEFTRIRKDSFALKFPPERIFYGLNSISVRTSLVHPKRPGTTSIDNILLRYSAKPITNEYLSSFQITSQLQNSVLNLEGFDASKIISIDSINGTIQFPTVESNKPKINVSLKMSSPFCGVYMKDTAAYDIRKGMHIFKVSSSKERFIENLFFPYYERPFFEFLENADSSDIFIVAYNDSALVQREYLYALDKFPFEKVKNIEAGQSWIFIFSKKKVYYEKISSENFSQISQVIDNSINKNYSAKLFLSPKEKYQFFVRDERQFSNVRLTPVAKPYLRQSSHKANAIVIYHPLFKEIAEDYVNFRKSNRNLSLKSIDIDDIYNEYNFGKKSPFAIKEFLQYAKSNWADSLMSVILIGNASWDPFKRYSFSIANDFIPTFGYPPSDFWYSILDTDFTPDISFGRISIDNVDDGKVFLDKLKEYELETDQPWMKNFLFLSGGEGANERRRFANMKSYFFDNILQLEPLCAISDSVAKHDESVGGVSESGVIREKINNGALWINFVGHANQNIFDMDGWQTYKLNNKGKYAFFSAISCNTGAFADPGLVNVRNEDYLFFKEKGFIGSIGSSYYGWVDENRYVLMRMFEQLADSNSKLEYIGDLLNYGKNGLSNEGPQLETKHHSALIGDPLLKLKISRKPNLYVYPPETIITSKGGNPIVNITDSLTNIHLAIYNNGFKSPSDIDLEIIDIHNNTYDTLQLKLPQICFKLVLDTTIDISKKPGEHSIVINIDPKNKLPYLKNENRKYLTNFYVYSKSLLPLDPLANWDIDINNPGFRVINPSPEDSIKYSFEILSDDGARLYESSEEEIKIFENYIDWNPKLNFDANHYILMAYYTNFDGIKSNKLQVPFYLHKKDISQGVTIVQNAQNSFNYNKLDNLTWENKNKSLKIFNKSKSIKVVSVGGNANIKRWSNIEIGNDVYVDSEYFRGFNIVTVPINSDSSKGHYRRFDTWVDGDEWTHDSTASRLVSYLRDSIPKNVYVLIATSGASWKLPALHKFASTGSIGTLDSLQAAIRNFGSKLIDSVRGPMRYDSISWFPWPHSFAMIGRKGFKPGEAIERMSPIGDSAYIEQDIDFVNFTGNFTSIPLGISKKWHSIKVKSNISQDSLESFKIYYEIFGKNYLDTINLQNGYLDSPEQTFVFQEDDSRNYREYILSLKYEKINEFSNPEIYSIEYNYLPATELAFSMSRCSLDDSERMRGEKTILHLTAENISKRTDTDNFEILLKNSTSSSVSEIDKISIANLKTGENIQKDVTIHNEILSNNNLLELILNHSEKEKENYKFNNKISFPFTVKDDSLKPNINVKFDGRTIKNGDYVSKNPMMKIQILDNSPLLFSDSSKIEIFINGKYIVPDSVKYYYFQPVNNLTNLKCNLFIIPNDLEFGDSQISPANNIKIIARDFYGNSDTLMLKVNVKKNNIIEEISVFPNPASEHFTLKYNFFGRNRSERTIIDIFDLNGQLITSRKAYTANGENILKINLEDNYGNSLPSGVYYFELKIESELWTDPRRGKLIITK